MDRTPRYEREDVDSISAPGTKFRGVTGNWFPTGFGIRKRDERVCGFESRHPDKYTIKKRNKIQKFVFFSEDKY